MSSGYNPDPTPETLARLRPGFYTVARVVELGGGADDSVGPGEEGELIVDATADTVFTGYLNRPDATAEKIRDGWYFTGDVVEAHENGDFTLMGRVDDMIRSGGESIHPEEVEAVLDAAPGVAECSVIGVADPKWGQIVVGCVVPAEGSTVSGAALEEHCLASSLAPYKRPRGYVFYDEPLPRNAANKVLRRILRADAEAARNGEGERTFEATGKG
jgi:acyl-CoA synthetase (AMP-forming)/AMP-acid ligase II